MSLELVGYIFLGWLGLGMVTALLLGRIMREASGLPVAATAVVRPIERQTRRAPRRAAGRGASRAA